MFLEIIIMFDGHYEEWRKNRVNVISRYIQPEFKSIMELGCGQGDLVALFDKDKYDLYGVEGRQEHIEQGKIKYPHINFIQGDLNKWKINFDVDVIIHTGVLYHLSYEIDLKKHLKQYIRHSKLFFLETEVGVDNYNPVFHPDPDWYDQALNGKAMIVGQKYIEEVLDDLKAKYTRLDLPELSGDTPHEYHWDENTPRDSTKRRRRMWMITS